MRRVREAGHPRGGYGIGRRKDAVFLQLQALLAPFGLRRFYTDGWGTSLHHLDPAKHTVDK